MATSGSAGQTIATRARLGILVLISVGTMINYLDRTVVSIAAPFFSKELQLDAFWLGIVFSAFSWTYAAAQIPGGVFLDRIGVKLTYFLSLTFWSLFTLLQGVSVGLKSLLLCRLGLGIAEAPCYPANSRVLNSWFPQHERARANGVFSVGQYVGLGLLSPVMVWLATNYGWRALLIIVGAIGIAFGLIWYRYYSNPHDGRANQAELDYIAAGGGVSQKSAAVPFKWSSIAFLLSKRQILGASLGQFCGNTTLVFFITWFPSYLVNERHMTWIKAGFFVSLPFIAASVGVLFGGALSDYLLRRTGSANIARKLPVTAGLLLASTIMVANFVSDDTWVIIAMSVAFFGQGMVNLGWTLISDVAPRALVGLTAGVFNLFANLAGIVTPLAIGYIVRSTGSYVWALGFVGIVALLGVICYVFVVGDVKRVENAPE
jgi:ACS family D-galactonate transporter-like MFS transporter